MGSPSRTMSSAFAHSLRLERSRRETDFSRKDRDEAPLAQTRHPRDLSHRRARAGSTKGRQGHRDRRVPPRRRDEPRGEHVFHQLKAVGGRLCGAQPFAKLAHAGLSPERRQVDVGIRQRAGGYAEDRGGAAWPEVHPHHRRVLHRVDDEHAGICPRSDDAGISSGGRRVGGIINPHLIVAQVDDELDRPARQDPLSSRRLPVRAEPEALDEFAQRWARSVGEILHGVRPPCSVTR